MIDWINLIKNYLEHFCPNWKAWPNWLDALMSWIFLFWFIGWVGIMLDNVILKLNWIEFWIKKNPQIPILAEYTWCPNVLVFFDFWFIGWVGNHSGMDWMSIAELIGLNSNRAKIFSLGRDFEHVYGFDFSSMCWTSVNDDEHD